MTEQTDLLTEIEQPTPIQRSKLIPVWMLVFAGLFLIAGLFVPIILGLGITGRKVFLSLYGFQSEDPISIYGLGIILLFILKSVVAFGLMKEKSWAIILGITDAIIGIVLCLGSMTYLAFWFNHGNFNFQLELFLLIPYLIKLLRIKPQWEA